MERRRLPRDPELAALEKCNLITDAISIAPNHRPKVIGLVEKMQMAIASRPPGETFRFTLEDFEFGGRLGSGTFCTVFLVKEKKSDFILALKSVDKELMIKNEMEADFQREILIHSKLSHTNIVKFLTLFEDSVNWYLLMEYVPGGNLTAFRENQKDGRVKPILTIKFTYQLADALSYLHSLQIVHRYVKPDNVLLDVFGNVKLSNFRWATGYNFSLHHQCDISNYVAPEMLEKKEYNCKVDVWSLGIIIYELLCGEIPFLSKDIKFMLKKIHKGNINYPEYVEESASDLISQLLKYDPKERIEASEIMNHPWLCL